MISMINFGYQDGTVNLYADRTPTMKHYRDVFGLRFYLAINSYGNVKAVSSPDHVFFLGKLERLPSTFNYTPNYRY